MQRWEYKEAIFYDQVNLKEKSGPAVSIDGEAFSFLERNNSRYNMLDQFGAEGWELVNYFYDVTYPVKHIYVFKRPRIKA